MLIAALFAVPVIANAGLFGPSGTDNDCTSNASFAWCLMDLAKKSKGIDDAKPGTMPVGYVAPGTVSKVVDGVGIGAQVVIGVSDIAKVSNYSMLGGFGGTMNLLAAAMDMSRRDQAALAHSIAILPKAEANPLPVIISAMAESMKKLTGAEMVEFSKEEPPGWEGRGGVGHFKLTGGELCASHSCIAVIGIRRGVCQIHDIGSPAWLSEKGESSLVRCGPVAFLAIDGKRVDHETLVYGLSKHLPESMYIYLPPSTAKPIATLVTKDKEYFFIQPEKK